jgi:hypothetical protein
MFVPNGIYFERYFMSSGDDTDSLIKEIDIAREKVNWDEYVIAAVPKVATVNKIKKFLKDKYKRLLRK